MKLVTQIRRAVVLLIGLSMPLHALAIAWATLPPGDKLDRLHIVLATIGVLNSIGALMTSPPQWRNAVRQTIAARFSKDIAAGEERK